MRSRNIKPGLYANEDLAECSFSARYIFPGLWMLADCYGRLENRPRRIKMTLLPGDSVDVAPLLDELAERGLIKFYGEGNRYIWIPGFTRHQSPHQNERAKGSKLPRHELDDHVWKEDKSESTPRVVPDLSESNHADSLILIPDMLNPDTLNPDKGNTPAAVRDDECQQILDSWNTLAKDLDLSVCRTLTEKRRKAIKARLKAPDWREEFPEALQRISASAFLRGKKPGNDWRADIDWILQPDSVTRILEGRYDDRPNSKQRDYAHQRPDAEQCPVPDV